MPGPIILSHGSDSSPDATKVSAMAALAETLGWTTTRPDYRQDDLLGHAASVAPRLARLRAAIDAAPQPPLLVGSSMGAFVSALASCERPVRGLFLLATPTRIPGYSPSLSLREHVPTLLVHGWRDNVCPSGPLLEVAAARRLPLLLVDDDHRLSDSLDGILDAFGAFLVRLDDAA